MSFGGYIAYSIQLDSDIFIIIFETIKRGGYLKVWFLDSYLTPEPSAFFGVTQACSSYALIWPARWPASLFP